MYILRNFLLAFANVTNAIASIYVYILIARALISWFSPDPYNNLYQLLIKVTEPVLGRIRNFLPNMGMDLSPIIALLAIQYIVKGFILRTIFDFANHL